MCAKKTEVLDSKCPGCGAKITFEPASNKWVCDHCGNSYTLEEIQKHKNASSEEKNTDIEAENVDDYDEYISYNCKNCGAEIITDAQTTATFCVYCGNTAILRNKLSGKFTPSRIIPFKKVQKDAEDAFSKLSKGRPLVPKDFTDQKNIEKIRGIYIPFWFHTFKVGGELNFRGETYQHWSTGNTHYTKTRVYDVEREGTALFESVPVDGSTRFDNALMNTIQPYDYKELVPYNHAYLSGFLAERYDVEAEETRKEVEKDVIDKTRSLFRASASQYTIKRTTTDTLKTEDYKLEYVLLPVYMVNVKYMGKMHTFAMNGQTGEFIGDIPVDRKKAVRIVIILLIVFFLVFTLAMYIAGKMRGAV